MLRDKEKSGGSTKRGKVMPVDTPTRVAPPTSARDPPPYGAQHRQDALWEGGNEVLPPRWHQFEVKDGGTQYQDHNFVMTSWNRPLPGVRLDVPGQQLIPGCEWHMSPLGRSYFVNHNTRTTSWKKPAPERPVGSLMPECVFEGHSACIWSLVCTGTGCNIISASEDGSIRQWIRDGKTVGEPWRSDGRADMSLAVSPDRTMVVSGSGDGRLRLWNVKEGNVVGDAWEGHSASVRCLDWSLYARQVASGSQDGTIRRWNPNTGRQIAPPIETSHGWVHAVKYSPRGDRFASGGEDNIIRVWSKDGKLLIEIKGHDSSVRSLCWSKDGAYIFSASRDRTIRQWQSIDGQALAVLCGHTSTVTSICLTGDEHHLVSASADYSVCIWDLKTNEQVGDPLLHDDELLALTITSDYAYIASAGKDNKVYLWSIEAALKRGYRKQSDRKLKGYTSPSTDIFDISSLPKRQAKNERLTRYGHEFWSDHTDSTPRRLTPRSGPSPTRRRNLFYFLHFTSRPVDLSPSIPLNARRWNFNLFTGRTSAHTVDVALAQDEDRYAIAPATEAEMAAAMQYAIGNEVDGSAHQGGAAAWVQEGPSTQTAQEQNLVAPTEESSDLIGCCGIFLVSRRSRSH